MPKDFTITKYRELLMELKAHYRIITVEQYFNLMGDDPGDPYVVLRHDVDRRPQNALRMAEVEAEIEVASTYYFRKSTFRQQIILDLAMWGHEIGYHYEVMDKARGEIGLAHALFNSELEILRAWVPVKTCSAHGNPVSKWDNRQFWQSFDLEQFGLIGEAEAVRARFYLTDTGRYGLNLKDWAPENRNSPVFIYHNIHPERWSWTRYQWYRQWLRDWGCNQTKRFIRRFRHGTNIY